MKIILKNINSTRKRGLLIVLIWLFSMTLSYLVEPFRGRIIWIYQYGKMISLLMFLGLIFSSLLNTIFLISENKPDSKNNLIWIFISTIPFLYFVFILFMIAIKPAY